jgi:uncharacterized protein YqjF (DUF2071 family)
MTQHWHDLLFAHWPLNPRLIRPLLPRGLDLDLYDGDAWIAVVPFWMSNVRVRWLPPVPTAGTFPELNVRTYVTLDDRPGVWFFSLDAASTLAVLGARRFHLPYFRARMRIARDGHRGFRYRSTRRGASPPARFEGSYAPESGTDESPLARWLTERYCLYTANGRGELSRLEIHHPPWTLHRASADITVNTVAPADGIPLGHAAPLLHYAEFQDVRFWWPERATD